MRRIFSSEHSLKCLALTAFLWVESLVYYLGNDSNSNYIENPFSFKAVKRKNINKINEILNLINFSKWLNVSQEYSNIILDY